MGWTGYNAWHFKKDGSIDRKAELDYELFRYEGEGGHKLIKSAVVGSVYYAAVQNRRGHIYGLVVLTQTNRRSEDGCNFLYKDMSEDMGPYECDCPPSILKLLSPTDNEYALAWRERCKKKAEQKKSPTALANLPIGTRIRFNYGGEVRELVKHAPAYQFKRSFWYNPDRHQYMQARRIPADYEILKERV